MFIPLFLPFLLPLTTALKMSLWGSEGCRGEPLETWVGGPNQGCQTVGHGQAESAIISSTGPVDDPFYVVFFSSDDCNPSTDISHFDSGCQAPGGYKSFEVWDMSKAKGKRAVENGTETEV